MTLYRIHGLLLDSEIELDAERVGAEEGRNPDYRIVRGNAHQAPLEKPPGRLLAELRFDDFGFWTTEDPDLPGRWTLRYAGVCQMTIDLNNRLISVHESKAADPGVVPMMLEGSALAHVLAADGRLVLHASAVEANGKALAIAGPTGKGKSTSTALLCAAGARLISEDALRCDLIGAGVICFPGSRTIRLRDKVAALADQIPNADVGKSADGRIAVTPPSVSGGGVELVAVVVPSFSRDLRQVETVELLGLDRAVEMLRHPRLNCWVTPDQIGRLFDSTTQLADRLRVLRATLPWGPPFPPERGSELLHAAGLD